jgi:hypothetical protein
MFIFPLLPIVGLVVCWKQPQIGRALLFLSSLLPVLMLILPSSVKPRGHDIIDIWAALVLMTLPLLASAILLVSIKSPEE